LETIQIRILKGLEVLEINPEIIKLSDFYRKDILINELNDTIHIATATYYGLDAIVSWNFKHIVNLNTIKEVHNINIINNYPIVEILTIENLGGSKYGNL
jgi:predicted nucleic acid-binding protein